MKNTKTGYGAPIRCVGLAEARQQFGRGVRLGEHVSWWVDDSGRAEVALGGGSFPDAETALDSKQ